MRKKNLYPFLVSLILLVAVIIINRLSFNSMKDYTEAVDQSREAITSYEELSANLTSAEIYSKTYSSAAPNTFYKLYKENAQGIYKELRKLRGLTHADHRQRKLLDSIQKGIDAQYQTLLSKNIVEIINSGEVWRLHKLWEIHTMINQGIQHERTRLNEKKLLLASRTKYTSSLTIILSIIALGIISVAFVSNELLKRKRRWLEGFLESILNTSQNGIVTYKAVREHGTIVDLKIAFANEALQTLLKIDPAKVIGKKLGDVDSFVKKTELFEKYVQVIETGQQDQFERLYKQGDVEKWLYVTLAKLEDGLTASFHDISDLKKYEEELKKNILQLEYSNKELEEYAYIASHDLQEPLRKIMTYASLLENSESVKLDDKSKGYIEKMMTSSQRMSVLIRDILNFSGMKAETSFVKTNLNEVLKNVLEDLELVISQKEAVVHVEQLPEIEAIPLQVHQLFFNLVSNALKFTRADVRPEVVIRSRELPAEEVCEFPALDKQVKYCEIGVADNGIGFSDQYSTQIFGLFKRLNDKKDFAGSGIGLALCRKVVANHHGELYAKGKEGEGATFYIILPLKQ